MSKSVKVGDSRPIEILLLFGYTPHGSVRIISEIKVQGSQRRVLSLSGWTSQNLLPGAFCINICVQLLLANHMIYILTENKEISKFQYLHPFRQRGRSSQTLNVKIGPVPITLKNMKILYTSHKNNIFENSAIPSTPSKILHPLSTLFTACTTVSIAFQPCNPSWRSHASSRSSHF